MYHGIINVYKEKGFTSHDVVAKMRGIVGQKKIGHTGTLDPEATGVLPVCLGVGTKLCDMLTDRSKAYKAVLQLGIVTDTQDTTGVVLKEQPVMCSEEEIKSAIMSFVGAYDQVPPMYSAIKVDGKRLYELARQGKEVERQARHVEIYDIEMPEAYDRERHQLQINVKCSKGTYIRTLCHDIGEKLGCGGAMASLERTSVGPFTVQNAYPLAAIQQMRDEGRLAEIIIPIDRMFDKQPKVMVKPQGMKRLLNGNMIPEALVRIEGAAADGASAVGVAAADGVPAVGVAAADGASAADAAVADGVSTVGVAAAGGASVAGAAVADGVSAADAAVADGVSAADAAVADGVSAACTVVTDGVSSVGYAIADGELCRMYDEKSVFYGIYKYYKKEKLLKPEKMFLMD